MRFLPERRVQRFFLGQGIEAENGLGQRERVEKDMGVSCAFFSLDNRYPSPPCLRGDLTLLSLDR